jgi:hypothetical protein
MVTRQDLWDEARWLELPLYCDNRDVADLDPDDPLDVEYLIERSRRATSAARALADLAHRDPRELRAAALDHRFADAEAPPCGHSLLIRAALLIEGRLSPITGRRQGAST